MAFAAKNAVAFLVKPESTLVNTLGDVRFVIFHVKIVGAELVPPVAVKLILFVESIKTPKGFGSVMLLTEIGVTVGHEITVPAGIKHVAKPC